MCHKNKTVKRPHCRQTHCTGHRTGHLRTIKVAAIACSLIVAASTVLTARSVWADTQATSSATDRLVLPIEHTGQIKAVLQITKDEMQEGVHKGLFALKKLHESYVTAGIDPKQIDLRAVYHGDAADHLLTDEAWNRWRKETGGNPSSKIIAELTKLGVHIELCNERRIQNGWSKEEVHANVLLAPNAYQRLIDLQLRGYAYIRF